jgi:hypothetical protein
MDRGLAVLVGNTAALGYYDNSLSFAGRNRF